MIKEKPEAIMINVPEAYFSETKDKEKAFRRCYHRAGGKSTRRNEAKRLQRISLYAKIILNNK